MTSKEKTEDNIWLYFDNLQSRSVPEAVFADGYSLHTGSRKKGFEEIWFDIVKQSFGKRFLRNRTLEVFKESLFRKPQFNKEGLFFVEHQNKYIASVLAWQDQDEVTDVGRLHWLCVLPDHRGRGIGKALCLSVLKFFKENNKTRVKLKTETYREIAIQLYESIGFVKVQLT